MLAPDRATLRAVEAAARALRTQRLTATGARFMAAFLPEAPAEDADVAAVIAALAAYHAALGETARVTRVERCAAVERAAKEAGDG